MEAANWSLRVLDRYGRLLLLVGAAFWLLAAAAGARRDWQDEWILADLVLPYLGFAALAAVVLLLEPSNSVSAVAASFVTAVLLILPAVKYVQPYGTAVDAVVHLQTVTTLMQEGRLPAEATYAAIPGMHAFLAAAGFLSGFGPEAMIGYVLPLFNALMPLLTYFLVRRAGLPAKAVRATVLLSCLAVLPGFRPNGSTFAVDAAARARIERIAMDAVRQVGMGLCSCIALHCKS